MSASSVTGRGRGVSAAGQKGPGNGRDIYAPLSGPHVIAAGSEQMRDNVWKLDVILPEPLAYGVDNYVVSVMAQVSTGKNSLQAESDPDRWYDYGTGDEFQYRVNKLDDSWLFDPDHGTNGSWYYTDDSLLTPGNMKGFTVHVSANHNDDPPPFIMWSIVNVGQGVEV